MKITEVLAPTIKARIDHPEDLVIDNGSKGAIQALDAMRSLASQPSKISIKFDGSPALIFGWDADNFVVTDKSGFGAKGYDGMTKSADALEAMLRGDTGRRIADTSQAGVTKRAKYAKKIAGLYDKLKELVPQTFKGFLQGDILWVGTPAIVNGNYEFGPVKIKYKVPENSALGKYIATSHMGIVIHSIFNDRTDAEPRAIDSVSSIGLNNVHGLVVVPHELNITSSLATNTSLVDKLEHAITVASPHINTLFNNNAKGFRTLLKTYLAWAASNGRTSHLNSNTEFVTWLDSDASKATDNMRSSIKDNISKHAAAWNALWLVIHGLVTLKLQIKSQLDKHAAGNIGAEYNNNAHSDLVGKDSHEGYVADTPYGKIKLVNRSEFMRKPDLLKEFASGGASSAGGVASIANPMGGVISRTPNLFGYIPVQPTKKKKTKTKRSKPH